MRVPVIDVIVEASRHGMPSAEAAVRRALAEAATALGADFTEPRRRACC